MEECVNILNNDVSEFEDFSAVQCAVVEKYKEYSETSQGVEIYHKLIEYLVRESDETYTPQIKYIIVYIFDKCEIFKREE